MWETAFGNIWQPELALVGATAVVAGFVRGMAGFGAALILTPVFSALYSPLLAVPTLGVADLLIGMPLTIQAWRRCRWREVLPLAIAAMAALPAGTWVLLTMPPVVLRVVMASFVLLTVAVLATGWRYAGTPGMPATLLVGGASGVMSGAIGMGGPPVVVFWLAGQTNAAQARANTIAFFGVASIGTQLMYWINGLLTPSVFLLAALLIPAYGTGLYVGARAFRVISETTFRIIALTLVAVVAATTLVAALLSLLSSAR
jgi:uncharacterized membrane protein YfcA